MKPGKGLMAKFLARSRLTTASPPDHGCVDSDQFQQGTNLFTEDRNLIDMSTFTCCLLAVARVALLGMRAMTANSTRCRTYVG